MIGMPVSLSFTESDIKLAAGARSFERGLGYFGAVGDLEIGDREVTASVYGTSEYTVPPGLRRSGTQRGLHVPVWPGRLLLQALCRGRPVRTGDG